jgi:hypothetical protein
MNEIASIVIPVFGLIGLGYLTVWLGVLSTETGEAMADFVFTIAIPLLIFRVIATADFSGGAPLMLWAAYYTVFAIAWAIGTFLVRRLFSRDARAGLVAGISSAYSNALLVGVPLIITAYGSEGEAAIALLIAIHMPVLMTTSAILIERSLVVDGLSADTDRRSVVASLAQNLLRNPIVIGLAAGLLWRFTGLPIAGPPGDIVNRLADTAATLALFSVGMSLRRYGVSRNVPQSLVVAAVKLVLMPAMVLLLAATVVPLPPVWAKAMVITAACPTGVNSYLVANRFGTGQALASNAITLTTALAVVTVTVWLQVVNWLL